MNTIKRELLQAYSVGILNLHQYRTMVGICDSGDEAGARKGLEKLRRKYRREQKAVAR